MSMAVRHPAAAPKRRPAAALAPPVLRDRGRKGGPGRGASPGPGRAEAFAARLLNGGWYDCHRNRHAHALFCCRLESGRLLEFALLDEHFHYRGMVLVEIVGQRATAKAGLPLILVCPIAAEDPGAQQWIKEGLAAPNRLVISKDEASKVQAGGERYHIQPVERARLVARAAARKGWAKDAMLVYEH